MIYDRTAFDVEEAKRIRLEVIQKGVSPNETEIQYLERGMMTVNCLNRIEEKIVELKNIFNSIGYWNNDIKEKHWDVTEIFNKEDFESIISKVDTIKKSFLVYSTTPSIPISMYHYKNINDIEKILHDLDVMINDIKSNYLECGNAETGE